MKAGLKSCFAILGVLTVLAVIMCAVLLPAIVLPFTTNVANAFTIEDNNEYMEFGNGYVGLYINNFMMSTAVGTAGSASDSAKLVLSINRGAFNLFSLPLSKLSYYDTMGAITKFSTICPTADYTNLAITNPSLFYLPSDTLCYVFTRSTIEDYEDYGYVVMDASSQIFIPSLSGKKHIYACGSYGNYVTIDNNMIIDSVCNIRFEDFLPGVMPNDKPTGIYLWRSRVSITYLLPAAVNYLAFNVGNLDYYDGYKAGVDVGYTSGEKEGYDKGFNQAKDAYYEQGYNVGYNKGIASANNYTFLSLIGAVIDAPLGAFRSMFNFEILGMNMSSFLLSLFSISIIIVVIKLLIGR